MGCRSCVENPGARTSLQGHLIEGGDESTLILATGRRWWGECRMRLRQRRHRGAPLWRRLPWERTSPRVHANPRASRLDAGAGTPSREVLRRRRLLLVAAAATVAATLALAFALTTAPPLRLGFGPEDDE